MKNLIFGIVLGLLISALGAILFIELGFMPVATKGPPLPFERWAAETAIHAAMRGKSDVQPAIEANEPTFMAAAKTYSMNCAVCHGTPNRPMTAIAKGLFPKPPQLFQKDDSVTDDPVPHIYWFVKNGIRLTGMPGFVDTLSDLEIWQVSFMLQKANELPPHVIEALDKN